MITIILENKKNEIVEKISATGNQDYLLKHENSAEFPILSEISDSDNEIVFGEQMPQLINELQLLKQDLNKKQMLELNEIIKLAETCKTNEGYFLIFTPFGSFWKNE